MQRRLFATVSASLVVCGALLAARSDEAPRDKTGTPDQAVHADTDVAAPALVSATEARGRARLLHEAFHATLQFVHDEYYRPDERLTLPASTLERVFSELERSHKVRLRWVAVNAQPMNVEHRPRDDFEKAAVAALIEGKSEYDRVEKDVYRYAGAITLTSACLKCHLPARTDNKDRAAALTISLPVEPASDSR